MPLPSRTTKPAGYTHPGGLMKHDDVCQGGQPLDPGPDQVTGPSLSLPIVYHTSASKGRPQHTVYCVDLGELMARMRVVLRRTAVPETESVFTTRDLTVDLAHRLVRVRGMDVQLTPTEYDLLRVLVHHAGKVLTHQQLLRQVWGLGYESESHLLRVNISNLRQEIESNSARPEYVITEPGVGYRLRIQV